MAGMLGYQSAWTDPASGKDLMGARWYSPSAGDFTSADTVHVSPDPDPAAGDPFAYAADNPLTYTDPTGHLISAGSPATNPNYQADTAYANVFTQTYQRVGVTQAKANAAKAAAAVVAAKKAAAQRAQQQAAAAAAKKRAEQKAAAEEAAKKRAEQQAAAEEAAKQQALNRSRSTALNPDDGKTGQVFINPGARDLGTGTTKTPVGNHGTETLITPGGSPVPLIFTNPGPPDLGTGTTKTPISDQGGIINAAENEDQPEAEDGEGDLATTPAGRPYSWHYLNETGPVRNIPGSVVDETIEYATETENLGDRTVYYDAKNDVTVVQSDATGKIMSVHRGAP